jgi:hypothetical protein
MYEINTFLGQLRDFFFNGVERPAEFIFRAALEIQVNWNNPDPLGQQPDELFEGARPMGSNRSQRER